MSKGGYRVGAGRPKGSVENVKSKVIAAHVLERIGEEEAWIWALDTAKQQTDPKTYMEILRYLTDRRDGKPKQQLEGSGEQGELVMRIISEIPRPLNRGNARNSAT